MSQNSPEKNSQKRLFPTVNMEPDHDENEEINITWRQPKRRTILPQHSFKKIHISPVKNPLAAETPSARNVKENLEEFLNFEEPKEQKNKQLNTNTKVCRPITNSTPLKPCTTRISLKGDMNEFLKDPGRASERQNQFKQKEISHPSQINSPALRFISKQLEKIIKSNETILKNLRTETDLQISLPLNNIEEISNIDKKLQEDYDGSFKNALVKSLAKFIPAGGHHSSSGLSKILSDELIMKYNWDGNHNRLALKATNLFKTVIFDAWKHIFPHYHDFEKSIRKQIFDAHNRINRKKK